MSGLQAIGEAAWALNEDRADVIIAGSSDSAVNPRITQALVDYALTTRHGPDAVRPFDAERNGLAPGEGLHFCPGENGGCSRAGRFGQRVYSGVQ